MRETLRLPRGCTPAKHRRYLCASRPAHVLPLHDASRRRRRLGESVRCADCICRRRYRGGCHAAATSTPRGMSAWLAPRANSGRRGRSGCPRAERGFGLRQGCVRGRGRRGERGRAGGASSAACGGSARACCGVPVYTICTTCSSTFRSSGTAKFSSCSSMLTRCAWGSGRGLTGGDAAESSGVAGGEAVAHRSARQPLVQAPLPPRSERLSPPPASREKRKAAELSFERTTTR